MEARVKSSWNDPKTRQQETAELIKSESWQQIVEGKSPEQIPLEMWASLDPATQKKMEKFSVEGAPKNSNHISYLELKNKMATDEDDFQKTNLFDYATELSSRDFKYFDDRQKELMKDDRSGLVKNRTNLRIVSDRLGAVGIKKSKYGGGKNDKKIAIFNRALDEKLETFALENNRAARENEVESIIDSMLIKGEVDETELGTGRFGTDEKFAFEGNFNSFTVDEVSNIPSQLKRAAENSLRKRNILVNDENIISMVNKHLERQNAK